MHIWSAQNLQALWTLSTRRLVDALTAASTHLEEHHSTLQDLWSNSASHGSTVNVDSDQSAYVELNKQLNGWQEPPDEQFEESKGFYDTPEFRNTQATRVLLQNRLLKARSRVSPVFGTSETLALHIADAPLCAVAGRSVPRDRG